MTVRKSLILPRLLKEHIIELLLFLHEMKTALNSSAYCATDTVEVYCAYGQPAVPLCKWLIVLQMKGLLVAFGCIFKAKRITE